MIPLKEVSEMAKKHTRKKSVKKTNNAKEIFKISPEWIHQPREDFRCFLEQTGFPDPARLGERGPELLRMDPGSSGHVYSNAVTTAMATPRYAGGPVMGDLDIGSTASTATAETQESSALPSMQRGAYTGTTSFANELKNGLMPIANVEAEMKAMRRDIKNLMTKVLTANGHF